jgi:drug/metabolite transporter (DMT)-like permease
MTPAAKSRLDAPAMGLMVLLCAIWGVQQVAIKVAAPGVAPLLQAALRSAGAALLVWAWCAARGVRLFERDGTLWPGLAAAALFAGEFAFIYWGLTLTHASRGVIFLYTAPFLVALGAQVLLPHERLRGIQWLGLACAFTGIATLFGQSLRLPSGREFAGDLMLLVGAVLWAATTLTIKASALTRAAAEKTLLYQLAGSALVLPIASLALGESWQLSLTPLVVGSLAFQIVVVAAASYLAWFWLMKHYPATRLSAFAFLTPVFGVLAGGALLGEPLSLPLLAALVLVGAGIRLVNR